MRSFLCIRRCTLAFDFQKDAVHLINEDHCLQDLGQLSSIVLGFAIQEVALQIDDAKGGHSRKLALSDHILCVGKFSVRLGKLSGKGPREGSFDKVVKH